MLYIKVLPKFGYHTKRRDPSCNALIIMLKPTSHIHCTFLFPLPSARKVSTEYGFGMITVQNLQTVPIFASLLQQKYMLTSIAVKDRLLPVIEAPSFISICQFGHVFNSSTVPSGCQIKESGVYFEIPASACRYKIRATRPFYIPHLMGVSGFHH